MASGGERAGLRRLIAGAVFDMAGVGLIAFSLIQERDELLWVGVGLMAVGSMLIVGWARQQSRLEAATPTEKPVAAWSVEPELALPPPRRVELTSTGRWRLWLWLAAVAAAVLYTNGYPRRAQPMEAAFAEFGVETEAVIHDKQQRTSAGGEPRYYLYYHFANRRGEQVRASIAVAELIYSSHREGDTIRVVYLPDDPLTHQVAGVEDNRFRPEGIAVLLVIVYMIVGAPVYLVMVGALAQALMLPFLAFAALYLRYRLTAQGLRPGLTWTLLLWISFASMVAVGLYQFGQQLALWG